MPRFTNGTEVVTVPHTAVKRYEQRGWKPVPDVTGPKALESYTVDELRGMADAQGIELGDVTKKTDIIVRLKPQQD